MTENTEKKKRRFQIKWWWDSDDERMAAQDPEYAKGLEKTDKIIKENDIEKDKIQDVKEEVINELQEKKDSNEMDQGNKDATGKEDDSGGWFGRGKKQKDSNEMDQGRKDATGKEDDSGGWFGRGKKQRDSNEMDQGRKDATGKEDDSGGWFGKGKKKNSDKNVLNEKENAQDKQNDPNIKSPNDSYSGNIKSEYVSQGNTRGKEARESETRLKEERNSQKENQKDGRLDNHDKLSKGDKKDEISKHDKEIGDIKKLGESGLSSSDEYRKNKDENTAGSKNISQGPENKKEARETADRDIEDKNSIYKYCYRILRFCALCNTILIVCLLLATEVIWDCTVTFNQIALFLTIIIGILPLILLIGQKNIISEIIGCLSVLAVIILVIYLFLNRIMVYSYSISINREDAGKLIDIQNQLWGQRWDSINQILKKNGIPLERLVETSSDPGVKLFLLKHPLMYTQSEAYTFNSEKFKDRIASETKNSPRLRNGAVVISPIIRVDWSKEESAGVLKKLASMKFSKLGVNYVLIIGVFSNAINFATDFRSGIREIDRFSISEMGANDFTREDNPKL